MQQLTGYELCNNFVGVDDLYKYIYSYIKACVESRNPHPRPILTVRECRTISGGYHSPSGAG